MERNPNRFTWPPERSDAAAAVALAAAAVLYLTHHWLLGTGAVVLVVVCFMWPASAETEAGISPTDGAYLKSKRDVDAHYEVVDDPDATPRD